MVFGGFSSIYSQVGINTETPKATLDVVAKETGKGFRLEDGNQGNNKVLMSDADGIGTWKDLDIPVADNNFKLVRTYNIQLNLQTTTNTDRTVLLGTIPSVEIKNPDNFIVCNIQSPTTIVNNTLSAIAYGFRLNIESSVYGATPVNIITNTGFADTTQIVPYSFYINQYPVGTHTFDLYGSRYNSNGSNASTRDLYFNAISTDGNGATVSEKKGLMLIYVYER
ncbi:hypothetical protein [Chryseobacterium sp. MYb7]|uniref:hypothetical protein n=1 Tax=Chryseobacterium sp. MYb7 TaxID=1827290 RepID=UPI000F50731A|nr:hypothetical protein [Chryseobacterium sp. MYb7]